MSNDPRPDSDPPYAWAMLPVAMLMQIGTSPGQTFGVALFNEPIRESLGLSHTELTGAYLVASALAAIPLMWIGRRMDRHGMRVVSIALVTAVALACFAISRASGVVALTACYFLLRAFGQGGLSLAAGNTLGMWFNKRLGLASGIAGVGMSCAIATTPLGFHYLIEQLGWRSAYAAIGTIMLVTLLPLVVVVYRNNHEPDGPDTLDADKPKLPSMTFRETLRTPAYWVASSCAALTGLICTAVFFNLVPLFDRNGFTAVQAAALFPTVAIAMALMQFQGGMLADRLPLRVLMAAAIAALGAGVLVVGFGTTLAAAHAGGVLLGAGQGLMNVTGNTLWPRYFGRAELGAIRSSVWTATVASCSVGPFLMGATLDLTGSYAAPLLLFGGAALFASAAAIVWGAPPVATRVQQTPCGARPLEQPPTAANSEIAAAASVPGSGTASDGCPVSVAP